MPRWFKPTFFIAFCLLLIAAGCSRTRPMPESAKKAAAEQGETPRGTRPPQTALPMPPIAAAHGSSDAGGEMSQRVSQTQSGWTMLDGRRARHTDYRGKVLVLDFWATYCPPCHKQTPHLIELQRRYGAQGLQIVGLNVGGPDDRPKVADFIEQYSIQYPLGYPDDEMSQLYFSDNSAIPQTYVFDRQGRLARRFIGFDDATSDELEQVIKNALAAGPAD